MAIAHDLTDRIDDLLPQTQCGKCGYNGCRPYAEAIAAGQAEINQCPPGGVLGIQRLAALLDRPALPLNPANGKEQPRVFALIDEATCIGCTKCIKACPVDAIVGAAKLMHSVIADECTGCELCLPPCPVDCITLVPAPSDLPQRSARQLRQRYHSRLQRLAHEDGARTAARKPDAPGMAVSKQSVLEAIARGKEKKLGK